MKAKNLFKTMLLALAVMPASTWAQTPDFGTDDVISTTTLWTFDQYCGVETVSAGTLVNYKGLYLNGNSGNPMTIERTGAGIIEDFGGQKAQIFCALRSKTGRAAAGTKASAINNALCAFNASVPGTVYVYARVENAERTISIAFNGTEVVNTTNADKSKFYTYSYTATEAGCFVIGATSGYKIGAIKFLPTAATSATEQVTMSDMGIMTFSSIHALTLTDDLKAYVVGKTATGSKLSATEVTGAIPAATGVILTGTPNKTYTLNITDVASSTRNTAYALHPVVIDYALPATYSTGDADAKNWDNYILVKDGEKMVFKQSTGVGNIAAGKAYYSIRRDQAKPAASAPYLTLDFGSETTGISQVGQQAASEVFYDLQGRRVAQPTKGLYIVNGKTVIIK